MPLVVIVTKVTSWIEDENGKQHITIDVTFQLQLKLLSMTFFVCLVSLIDLGFTFLTLRSIILLFLLYHWPFKSSTPRRRRTGTQPQGRHRVCEDGRQEWEDRSRRVVSNFLHPSSYFIKLSLRRRLK